MLHGYEILNCIVTCYVMLNNHILLHGYEIEIARYMVMKLNCCMVMLCYMLCYVTCYVMLHDYIIVTWLWNWKWMLHGDEIEIEVLHGYVDVMYMLCYVTLLYDWYMVMKL